MRGTGGILADLWGRRAEREQVDNLLTEARAGRSGVLVVRGEAGIGKTALLEHARDRAIDAGFRVESCCGVESETQFALGGLHQLCAPLLGYASRLVEPQQDALNIALGMRSGDAPDRFLVGLAVLNLLAEASDDAPLLCIADDVQWLDPASAQILSFVARRVAAERIVLLFGVRDSGAASDTGSFGGIPELLLRGLSDADARRLMLSELRGPIDEEVRERIIAEARGNPLALLELFRDSPPGSVIGGFGLPDARSIQNRIEETYARRSGTLPPKTQLLLLVAAADPTGDVALLWRAARLLDIEPDAAADAESAGLLEIDSQVRFRHPLVRSAVYYSATPPDHRLVHAALADATDERVDPDRRAWHRAQAVQGVDEDAAADLERSAQRARGRGGFAAAAAFLQRAVEVTPAPDERARRALDAAHATFEAGAPEISAGILAVAESGTLDDLSCARLTLLRAQIALQLTPGSHVPRMLLDAAVALAPLDAGMSRETYLHALDAAVITGGTGQSRGATEAARAARSAPPTPEPPRAADLLLDGLLVTYAHGYAEGVPILRRALEAFRTEAAPGPTFREDSHRWLWLATRTAAGLFHDELGYVLAERNIQFARDAGALATLPGALSAFASAMVLDGKFARARELASEGRTLTRAIGATPHPYGDLFLSSWSGDAAETTRLIAASLQTDTGPGDGTGSSMAHYASAVLHNGLGNYATALAAAERAFDSEELANNTLSMPELVEAAARTGHSERATAALEELVLRADASGTDWALGVAARSLALTSTGTTAEVHYRTALTHLETARMAAYVARTHLVFGEWLRREGRRQDAREHLRTAHRLLSGMGAEAFAARAARELRATGENPRKRKSRTGNTLTEQELHIARLVSTGATSREVGAQLFLSPRTVDAHLRSIFGKLGITSRRQVRDHLP